jgi:tRNA (mo5U34)-methyltransferase
VEANERNGATLPDPQQSVDASTGSADLGRYFWWHSIRLDDGRVTPGRKSLALMDQEYDLTFQPVNLPGKSLLDIGAWNGGFSIEAVRRGASRVIALDHTAWNSPTLRGRTTFDIATRLCNVAIETIDQDLDAPQLFLAHLGSFDIVLCLGVFNHLMNPLAALREVASLAREVLVLEVGIEEDVDSGPAMVLYPGNDPTGDGRTWWGPNRRFIEDFLRLLGFDRIDYSLSSSPSRGIFHAFRTTSHVAEIDWLSMMSVGDSGHRLAGGEVVSRITESGGHVVFGPYVTLLPGVYMLTADISVEASQHEGWHAMLEVVGPDLGPLACRKFRLNPGRSRLRLPFKLARPEMPDRPFGPLEFRITCRGSTLFQIHTVKTGPCLAFVGTSDVPDAAMDTSDAANASAEEKDRAGDPPCQVGAEPEQTTASRLWAMVRGLVEPREI